MTLKSLLSKLAKAVPVLPDVAHVAEETSAREVNRMLAQGWKLLLVVAVADGAGSYLCYVLGRLRQAAAKPDEAMTE